MKQETTNKSELPEKKCKTCFSENINEFDKIFRNTVELKKEITNFKYQD